MYYMCSKRIVGIIEKVHRFEHTNLLIHRFVISIYIDLVKFKIVQTIHKPQLNWLPPNLLNRLNSSFSLVPTREHGFWKTPLNA